MNDLQSEIGIRGAQPPLHLVQAEFDALRAAQDHRLSDPKIRAERERQLEQDIQALRHEARKNRLN
jgi:hypothetical protein